MGGVASSSRQLFFKQVFRLVPVIKADVFVDLSLAPTSVGTAQSGPVPLKNRACVKPAQRKHDNPVSMTTGMIDRPGLVFL